MIGRGLDIGPSIADYNNIKDLANVSVCFFVDSASQDLSYISTGLYPSPYSLLPASDCLHEPTSSSTSSSPDPYEYEPPTETFYGPIFLEQNGHYVLSGCRSHITKKWENRMERNQRKRRRKLGQTTLFDMRSGRIEKIVSQDLIDGLEKGRNVLLRKRANERKATLLKSNRRKSKTEKCEQFAFDERSMTEVSQLEPEDADFVFEVCEHQVEWTKESVKFGYAPDLSDIDEREECVLEQFEQSSLVESDEDCF